MSSHHLSVARISQEVEFLNAGSASLRLKAELMLNQFPNVSGPVSTTSAASPWRLPAPRSIFGVGDRPNSSLISWNRSPRILIKKVTNGSILGAKFMVIFPWFHVHYGSRKHVIFNWQLQSVWIMRPALRQMKTNLKKKKLKTFTSSLMCFPASY